MWQLARSKKLKVKVKLNVKITLFLIPSSVLFFFLRNGVLGAKYLPVKIVFDQKTKRLYPEPIKDSQWISVCGGEDKQCEKSCKKERKKKLRNVT